MSNEEAQKILDSMHSVNPENLRGEAKKLFEAVMKIADERDLLREKVERQNLEIMAQKDAHAFDTEITKDVNEKAIELFKELKEKEQIINAMVEYIANLDIDEDICKKMGIFKDCEIKDVENCKKCIIKYFRKKYK